MNQIQSDSKRTLIPEVAQWKLEAKLEDGDRYFYTVSEVHEVLNGKKAYVIGRKGTGKTAIAEHLLRSQDFNTFTEKLTFKNFPFNELYALKNDSYNSPNQYITVWKYLIYSCVCKMMVRNQTIDANIRAQLEKIYVNDPSVSLSRTVSRWTSREFGLNILGSGLTIKLGSQPAKTEIPLPERVELLEDIVIKYTGEAKYFIIFDELDEDYKDILAKTRNEEYFHLLTSLFKAVQDVRSSLSTAKRNIYPVIFLRDDIYDFIRDADKNKWKDYYIALEWNIPKIQDLLAFRISRAIEPHREAVSFGLAWGLLMANDGGVHIGDRQRNEMSKFDYIARSTYLRPRDFIRFLQVAAEDERVQNCAQIRASTLKRVDKAFSNYLRDEIIDETYAIIPEIEQVLDIISQIRKQTFSQDAFREMYRQRAIEEGFTIKDPDFILRVLFHFSVIGNQPRQINTTVFQYMNKDARINRYENIVLHRGLFKALGIV